MEDEILISILEQLKVIRASVDFLADVLEGEFPPHSNDADASKLIGGDDSVHHQSLEGGDFEL